MGVVPIRASSEHPAKRAYSIGEQAHPACSSKGCVKSGRWASASLPRDWLALPPSRESCAVVWGDNATSSMFAKHAESEATALLMAQMVALAIGGGRLGTPGAVDPAAAPRLAG